MNRPTPAHQRGMPPPPQLARYGSAPGSFLAALADSVARGGGGGEVPSHSQPQQQQHQQHQPVAAVVSRFFSGESSGLTSCESSCRTADAPAPLQRAYGGSSEIHVPLPQQQQQQPGLLRHSSSPAGLLSRLMADPHGNGGMGGARGGMGSGYAHSQGGGNVDAVAAQQRRLSSQWSFSRQQDMMPHIAEMGMAMHTPTPMPPADVGESIGTGHGNGSGDLSRSFSMSSWDDTNSNIIFSAPGGGGKKAKLMADGDDGMVTSYSNIDSQFGSSLDMPGMDDYLQLQQDSVACRVRAKRGCATHPRSIAERERRTRISKRLRRLQDLVPNMDKQTNTSDMLDIAVDYIKVLQDQIEKLKQDQGNCSCSADQTC
ncbi:transcription factor bHLH128-like [Triticum dicoccoides]|uniref:transcription factor bHLH128-like n=1 Tax=Triticum dicoccoides TaxID=85692 RepID=UPI00188F67FC|nr:transcription factor bHLH128-like [Triticum dicoccoides]